MNIKKFLFHSTLRAEQFLGSTKIFRSSTGKSKVVFFPGCSLSGYNPDYVFNIRDYLREKFGDCGIIAACCAKPLQLMGDTKTFNKRIESVRRELDLTGAETVITACQNCFRILKKYDKKRKILPLWTVMQEHGLSENLHNKFLGLNANVQDSCTSTPEIISSVRKILSYLGVKVNELPGKKLKCCGGRQTIITGDKKLGNELKMKRANEFRDPVIISYCASCRSAMSIDRNHKSIHFLDLIFGKGEISKKSFNMLNRLILAKKLKYRER